jgi:hypothetical protein
MYLHGISSWPLPYIDVISSIKPMMERLRVTHLREWQHKVDI